MTLQTQIRVNGPKPKAFNEIEGRPWWRSSVVSALAFYSDNPSSNPGGYLNFLFKKTKIIEKEPNKKV